LDALINYQSPAPSFFSCLVVKVRQKVIRDAEKASHDFPLFEASDLQTSTSLFKTDMEAEERPRKVPSGLKDGMGKFRAHKRAEPSDTSINPLKKRQRDLARLLAHTDALPADVKIGYERELASCRHDLQIAQDKLRRNQMIKKYHMVRFFG